VHTSQQTDDIVGLQAVIAARVQGTVEGLEWLLIRRAIMVVAAARAHEPVALRWATVCFGEGEGSTKG